MLNRLAMIWESLKHVLSDPWLSSRPSKVPSLPRIGWYSVTEMDERGWNSGTWLLDATALASLLRGDINALETWLWCTYVEIMTCRSHMVMLPSRRLMSEHSYPLPTVSCRPFSWSRYTQDRSIQRGVYSVIGWWSERYMRRVGSCRRYKVYSWKRRVHS